jgi:hypothetical protein
MPKIERFEDIPHLPLTVTSLTLQRKVNQRGQVASERISRRHAAQVSNLRRHNHPDSSVRRRSAGKNQPCAVILTTPLQKP